MCFFVPCIEDVDPEETVYPSGMSSSFARFGMCLVWLASFPSGGVPTIERTVLARCTPAGTVARVAFAGLFTCQIFRERAAEMHPNQTRYTGRHYATHEELQKFICAPLKNVILSYCFCVHSTVRMFFAYTRMRFAVSFSLDSTITNRLHASLLPLLPPTRAEDDLVRKFATSTSGNECVASTRDLMTTKKEGRPAVD